MNNFPRAIGLALLVLLVASCTGPPQYKDYYVSISGSDSTGNGSLSKPWRTIQYALDHATASGVSTTVRINLAKGIYNENIVINDEVVIRGAGSSQQVTTWTDPLVPVQNVSVISRQSIPNKYCWEIKSVYANNAGEVHLENLNIYGGHVSAENSDFSMNNVIVYGVQGWEPTVGCYGVQVKDSSFSVLNSRIETGQNYYADYGFNIIASSGFVTDTFLGNGFDHVINVIPWDKTHNIDPYNLPTPKNIYITGVTIEGSSVYYADGIRIQGAANVVIRDSKITRAAGGDAASSGAPHNPPYAAIEVAGYMVSGEMVSGVNNQMRRVEIIKVQTSGFDVGIGVKIATLQLKVENSIIQGLSYGVETLYTDYSGSTEPIVDFGGGPLSSSGGNWFSDQPKYAYYHDTGTYDVSACYNVWLVSQPQIDPLRIYDKLDKPSLGKVKWDCSGSGVGTSQEGLVVTTPTKTVSPEPLILIAAPIQNANCRLGNSAAMFDIVDTLYPTEKYSLLGRGPDSLWVAVIGPIYGARCWVFIDSLILLLNDKEVEIGDLPDTMLPIIPYPPMPTATNTEIPVPTATFTLPVTQCNDGIDNDADGFIDLADSGCSSLSDDDEGR